MTDEPLPMRLDRFDNHGFDRGAPRIVELLWLALQAMIFSTWFPGSRWRCTLLRLFGATIGRGVVIKPHVRVKFPWRLEIGDHVWIGEEVWIDNLVQVSVGGHSCISQGAYLCTGSHDWSDPNFGLITRPILIGKGCWVAARATLAPGCEMQAGAVLGTGALGRGRLSENTIHLASGETRPRRSREKDG